MAFEENKINPDDWTPEEMLKHVFRAVQQLEEVVQSINEKLNNDNKHSEVMAEIDQIKKDHAQLREDHEVERGKKAGAMWVMGAIITVFTVYEILKGINL